MSKPNTAITFSIFFIAVILSVVSLASGAEYSVRLTKYGRVRGYVEDVYGQKKVEKFFGIPYASPPLDNLRLEGPVPPVPWGDMILDTLDIPPACPQATDGVAYIEYHVPGFNKTSEDCLYLNIYVPRGTYHQQEMPVLFFVHGGSYQNGMGAMFDGSALATHGVVVVTFNYRLGPLGFMTAADNTIRGNYGMLDMIAALQWIQENIVHFNGDPNSVTIDGHSAGGCSVGLLLVSPLAKGLFHRVIQQSGSTLGHWAVTRFQNSPNVFYKIFTSSVNCYSNSSVAVKKCIQSLDTDTLQKVIMKEFEWSTSLTPQYRPVVDGYFLPQTPEFMVDNEPLNADTFFTGATQDEGLIAAIPLIQLLGVGKTGFKKLLSLMSCFRGDLPDIPDIVDSVLDHYVHFDSTDLTEEDVKSSFSQIVGDYFITAPTHLLADRLSQRNVSVYLYNYEYNNVLDQLDGAFHGAELFYLSGFPFAGHKNFRYDHVDKEMAKVLLRLWANFIKYGKPSLHPHDDLELPRYYPQRKTYTRIFAPDREPKVSFYTNLRHDKMSFWNEKVPQMFLEQWKRKRPYVISINSSNSDDSSYPKYSHITSKNTWILVSVCIGLSVLLLVVTVQYFKMRKRVIKLLRQNSISSGDRMLNGSQV